MKVAASITSPTLPAVRPFRDDDVDGEAVRALFWATMVGGAPAPFDAGHRVMRSYEELCLGWYLTHGARWASVVVGPDDLPTGYVLVCCDESSARAWSVRHSGRFVAEAARAAVGRDLDPQLRTFVRLRVRDAATLARPGRHPVPPAHAHLNLAGVAKNTGAVLAVRDAIDDTVRDAGYDAWAGEINTRRGRRAAALGRSGFDVVGRDANHTLSWLTGEAVDRLTVVRRLPR